MERERDVIRETGREGKVGKEREKKKRKEMGRHTYGDRGGREMGKERKS